MTGAVCLTTSWKCIQYTCIEKYLSYYSIGYGSLDIVGKWSKIRCSKTLVFHPLRISLELLMNKNAVISLCCVYLSFYNQEVRTPNFLTPRTPLLNKMFSEESNMKNWSHHHKVAYHGSLSVQKRTMDKLSFNEPKHEISNNVVCATSKASDQPAHTRSLIRAFASRLNPLGVLSYWPNILWRFLA